MVLGCGTALDFRKVVPACFPVATGDRRGRKRDSKESVLVPISKSEANRWTGVREP